MSRKEQLRSYWGERLPPSEWMYLADAARWINRGLQRPLVSRRTLQRRASEGALLVFGGSERAVREYKVMRTDLIDWLVEQDLLVGSEPPAPRDRSAPALPPPVTQSPPRAGKPRHIGQRSLFEE